MSNTEITDSKQESIDYLNELFDEAKVTRLKESEIENWAIKGGESYKSLNEMANDFFSDLATEACEARCYERLHEFDHFEDEY